MGASSRKLPAENRTGMVSHFAREDRNRGKSPSTILLLESMHLWNDAIHGSGKASVSGSVRFVVSYYRRSVLSIRHGV